MKKSVVSLILVLVMLFSQSAPLSSLALGGSNPFEKMDSTRDTSIGLSNNRHGKTDQVLLDHFNSQAKSDKKTFSNADDCYIVHFKNSASLNSIYQCISGYPYKLLSNSKERMFRIETNNLSQFKSAYANLIGTVSKDNVIKTEAVPNDPDYARQWALQDINLPQAWNQTKGSDTVKVAVIDTGFDRNAEDFNASEILNGYDVTTNTVDVTTDDIGHGTSVASVIGAATNNFKEMAGACWSVTLVPYKVADSNGAIYDSYIDSAIEMAADDGCGIINLSLGSYYSDSSMQSAISYAENKGCIVVAAAGNEGDASDPDSGNLSYPASYSGVISVAAVDNLNRYTYFSQHNSSVDVAAPGMNVLVYNPTKSPCLVEESGTSFSSPYVAAVAALARSENPSLTSDEFLQLIKQTSTDLGSPSYDAYYGWGLINAEGIVDAANRPIVCGVVDGATYASSRTVTFNKGTATLNGSAFNSGTAILQSGHYTLVVTGGEDVQTISFTIDTTPLTLTGISGGGSYNSDRTITFNKGTALLNGVPFVSGSTVSAEGNYQLNICDSDGTMLASDSFTIDKTCPVVTGIADGGSYYLCVTPSFSEGTATLDGSRFTKGTSVSTFGTHTMVVTDMAGNVTTVHFTIGGTNLTFASSLTKWVMDDGSGYLCAISNTAKALYFINVSTFQVDKTLSLGGAPTDIADENGQLYIALSSGNQIIQVDTATQSIANVVNTAANPYRIVVDGTTLYYGEYSISSYVHKYDLTSKTDTPLSIGTFSYPTFAVNSNTHMLYIGSNTYPEVLYDYNPTTKAIATSGPVGFNTISGKINDVIFDGTYVLFAGRVFAPDDPTKVLSSLMQSPTVSIVYENYYSVGGCILETTWDNQFGGDIYSENTFSWLGTLNSAYFSLFAFSNSGALYTYNDSTKTATKIQTPDASVSQSDIVSLLAAPTLHNLQPASGTRVDASTLSLKLKVSISDWILSKDGSMIYAISASDSTLLYINAVTLDIENVSYLPSSPAHLFEYANQIYVSEPNSSAIAVFDEKTRQPVSTISIPNNPSSFVIDNGSIYYISQSTTYLYKYDLSTKVATTASAVYHYNPLLSLNSEDHIVYIGESYSSGNDLSYYSTESDSLIGAISLEDEFGIFSQNSFTVCSGKYVYYDGIAFMDDSPIPLYQYPGAVIMAANGMVFTNYDAFVRDSGDYVKSIGYANKLLMSAGGDLFTYNASLQTITKAESSDNTAPAVSGVENGKTYEDAVTVTYDKGMGYLDGNYIASGTTVTTEGSHTLAVVGSSLLSTVVSFSLEAQPPVITGVADGRVYLGQVTISFDKGNAFLDGNPFTNGNTVSALGSHTLLIEYGTDEETLVTFAIASASLDDGTAVTFNDNKLKEALIKLGADANGDGTISRGEMRSLPLSVNLYDLGITDLTGLEYATNLSNLDLSANSITDLSPLSTLTQLTDLDLSMNQISDISPLAGMTHLAQLSLATNRVSDITALQNMAGLGGSGGVLDLSDNLISNLAPLSGLSKLNTILLGGNSVSDISPLSGLSALAELDLSKNKIASVSALLGLTQITYLDLAQNQFSDISPLAALTSLNSLDLSGNTVADCTPLRSLSQLSSLNLSGCGINDLSFLSGMGQLLQLDLSKNSFTNASTLYSLSSLQSLDLSGNKLTSYSFFSGLDSLWSVNLSDCGIRDLSVLSSMPDLSELILADNGISDLSGLKYLNTVNYLDLSGNKIDDLSGLSGLSEPADLYDLNLSDNHVEFVDGLTQLSNLASLDISHNGIGDISPLKGMNLTSLDASYNFLDLSAGSVNMGAINALTANGAHLNYQPQKPLADDDAPTITIAPYLTAPTNKDITVTASSNKGRLNAASHTFTQNGSFTFTATDGAGKSITQTVPITNIDKTPPEVTGVSNGGLYSDNRTVCFNEGTATLNGAAFSSGAIVSGDGTYTLVVTDSAGNSTTVKFTIDETAPVVSGVTSGSSYNTPKTITFNEGTATLNGMAFSSGGIVSAEGVYTLNVMDSANNDTSVTFTIDRTAPVVSGVTNGIVYNAPEKIAFNEGTATLNGEAFTSGGTVTDNGVYTLKVTDSAGNTTTVVFVINQNAPVVSGVINGGDYNISKTITFNEGAATLNGAPFTNGTTVSADGRYKLVVSDSLAYVTTISFTIDKTPPVLTVGSYSTALTNKSITVTAKANEGTLNAASHTFTVNGSYTFIAVDAAGNKTYKTVTVSNIDKTPPIVTAPVANGHYTSSNVKVSVTDSHLSSKSVKENGKVISWPSNNTFTSSGSYVITATDKAGNVSKYSFAIDKTPPVISVKKSSGASLNCGAYVNSNVVVSISRYSSKSVTKDGKAYGWPGSGTFSANGNYDVTAKDEYGMISTFSFTIDKTAPTINVKSASGVSVAKNASVSGSTTISYSDANYATRSLTLNGKAVSWPSGGKVTAKGTYVVTVTDKAGNKSVFTFKVV